MLRFAMTDIAHALVPDPAAVHKDEDTYDRHAGNLYRQALFTLDNAEMAEQVVSDVIVEECVRPAAVVGGQDARGRLAVSAYRRCMDLAGSPPWTARVPAGRAGSFADSVGPGGLNASERGAARVGAFRRSGVQAGRHRSGHLCSWHGGAAARRPHTDRGRRARQPARRRSGVGTAVTEPRPLVQGK